MCMSVCDLVAADSKIHRQNLSDRWQIVHDDYRCIPCIDSAEGMHKQTDRRAQPHPALHILRLADHFRPKVCRDGCGYLSACLIVHALLSTCSSMMPFVSMTHASINSKHVVSNASTLKHNCDKKSRCFVLHLKQQTPAKAYKGNMQLASATHKDCVSSSSKALPATVSRKRMRRSHLRSFMLSRL